MNIRILKTTLWTLCGFVVLIGSCNCSTAETDEPQPGTGSALPTGNRLPGYDAGESLAVEVARPTGARLVGLGVELDPHFLSQNTTRPDGPQPAIWHRIVTPRIRQMQIERFRVMLLPHWWEPENDNDDPDVADMSRFTFDSKEMESLYAVLDIAQETGADVTLVLWGCPTSCEQVGNRYFGRHFLCDPDAQNWVVEPASDEEFAESFSTVVKYLIEERGYTCIKELTPFNEPDGNVCQIEHYVPLVKTLDAKLRRDGIRDRVKLNLSDNTDTRRFFLEGCANQLAAEADLFNSHTYIFGYETPNRVVESWEKANVDVAARAGKCHMVGEFGSNQCVGATRQRDIDKYERGVLMTRHVVNFLNAGAVGCSYWSLIDQYYGRTESYQAMQQLGLWRYLRDAYAQDPDKSIYPSLKEDFEVRPQYYAYSLLTRVVRKGSQAFPLDLRNDYAAGTALLSADGEWSYVLANGSDEAISLDLKNGHRGGTAPCEVYRYVAGRLPEGDALLPAAMTLESVEDAFRVHLPAQSVVVLTQRQLTAE